MAESSNSSVNNYHLMKLYEIKAAAAAYLRRTPDECVVNSVDLALMAVNQVRLEAELIHNFEFNRKLVTVTVDGVTGGSLDNAVLYGTTTPVQVKAVVDCGLFDETGNLRAVEWTTVAESFERQRQENPGYGIRYPTDGEALCGPLGQRRFVFSGTQIYFFPSPVEPAVFRLGMEVWAFNEDWTPNDDNLNAGPWLLKGHQYLQWKAVIQLNHLFKEFVGRQEGNLVPPDTLAMAGLEALKSWDIFRYEQSRRHGR